MPHNPTALLPAAAPKASLNAFFRLLRRSPKAEGYEADGLVRWHTAIPHPWFNGVLATRPPGKDETGAVQSIQAYFTSQRVTAFTWWLEPELSSTDWAAHLLPLGFIEDQSTPGMTADLADLPQAVPVPDSFAIRPVADKAELATWMDTFINGYGLPAAWTQASDELFESLGMELPLRHYLGYLEGEPVAAATLFLSDGIAGIYNVGVLEAARGQGLGAAITLAPLQAARGMGYSVGALQSSEMGFRVYQRLGFQKTCDMEHFYWTAST